MALVNDVDLLPDEVENDEILLSAWLPVVLPGTLVPLGAWLVTTDIPLEIPPVEVVLPTMLMTEELMPLGSGALVPDAITLIALVLLD